MVPEAENVVINRDTICHSLCSGVDDKLSSGHYQFLFLSGAVVCDNVHPVQGGPKNC